MKQSFVLPSEPIEIEQNRKFYYLKIFFVIFHSLNSRRARICKDSKTNYNYQHLIHTMKKLQKPYYLGKLGTASKKVGVRRLLYDRLIKEIKKRYLDKNEKLQFNFVMDIWKKYDNVEKREFSKEEVAKDTDTEENNNLLQCENNEMRKNRAFNCT